MTVLSDFLTRDLLAAAIVATVLSAPAEAAARRQAPAKAPSAGMQVAAKPSPATINLRIASDRKEAEARLVGVRKAYDGLLPTREILHEGTRACMRDQRWLLMKVRDSIYDDGTDPSDGYMANVVERLGRAVDVRRGELSASKAVTEAPLPERDPAAPVTREAERAGPDDLDRLRASVDHLRGLRTSCLRWAERTIEQVSAAASAPMATRLDRIREARAAAERDYRSMQSVSPESAGDVLAAMETGPETATLRLGSL